MRARAFPLLFVLGATALAVACGLEAGGPGTDGDGGPGTDTGADGGWSNDGPANDQGASDAMDFDIPDLGTSETEAGSCTCVPPIPNGYTVVALASASRPACPPSYGTAADVVENPTAGASTCTCSCSLNTSGTCACGADPATFNLTFDSTNSCGGNGGTDTAKADLANGCNNVSHNYNATGNGLDWEKATPATPCTASGGSCNAPTKTQVIPSPTADQSRSCQLTGSIGSCGMDACVPTPGVGYAICVTNNTLANCPADFPISHVVGDQIADTRTCGPDPCNSCAFTAATCTTPTINFYDKTGCNNGDLVGTLLADGACHKLSWGNNQNTSSQRYSVGIKNAATCNVPGAFSAQGGLDVTNPKRVCCR